MDQLLVGETKFSKLLTDLEYEINNALHNIVVLESKLTKSEVSLERIDWTKNSTLSS